MPGEGADDPDAGDDIEPDDGVEGERAAVEDRGERHQHIGQHHEEGHDAPGQAVVAVFEVLRHGEDAGAQEPRQEIERHHDHGDRRHPLVAGDGQPELVAPPGQSDEVLGGNVGGDEGDADEPPVELAAGQEVVLGGGALPPGGGNRHPEHQCQEPHEAGDVERRESHGGPRVEGKHHLAISRGGAQATRTMKIIPVLAACLLPAIASAQVPAEPPNAPAAVTVTAGRVVLTYQGRVLFEGTVSTTGAPASLIQFVDSADGRVTEVLKWTATSRDRVTVVGVVHGSPEAFAAESEPREDGLRVVRHAIGPVNNRLNRAVYDRRADWLLSVDVPAGVEVTAAPAAESAASYQLTASGGEVSLRFRPRFYQKHRGLAQYRPWEYQPWTKSVAGWTSWYAYFDKVTEQDIRTTADVLGEVLHPFGYDYLQIDDGYQTLPIGLPSHWLNANEKFPGGLDALRTYISGRGLEPGIWTNVSFADKPARRGASELVCADGGREARQGELGRVRDGRQLGRARWTPW